MPPAFFSSPLVLRLDAPIQDVVQVDDVLLVCEPRAIARCGIDGVWRDRVELPLTSAYAITPLGDGLLVRDRQSGAALVRGGVARRLEGLESRPVKDVVAVDGGFAGSTWGSVFIERAERIVTPLDLHTIGLRRTRIGLFAWSRFGWALLDEAGGEVLAQGRASFEAPPLVLDDVVVGASGDGAVVVQLGSGTAHVHPEWRTRRAPAGAVEGVALSIEGGLGIFGVRGGRLELRRQVRLPWTPRDVSAAPGAWIAEAPWDTHACAVVSATGAVSVVPLAGDLRDVGVIDGGVALFDGSAEVRVIDPQGGCAERGTLLHDFPPGLVRMLDAGLATAEGDVLRVFDPRLEREQAAPIEPAIADPPMGVGVVVDTGRLGRRVGEGRYAYAFETRFGRERVARGTPYRLAMGRDEATAALDGLLARMREKPLLARPALLREIATEAHLAEIALGLGESDRVLVASVLAAEHPLVAPFAAEGWEYLGRFETSGALVVSDPCHRNKRELHVRVPQARAGTWFVWVRPGAGTAGGREAELVAVHANGASLRALEVLPGIVGVDAGVVGIYDAECAMPDLNAPLVVGPFRGKGAHSHSGFGDGGYRVLVARAAGEVVKVRVPFIDGEDDTCLAVVEEVAEARPYSPRTRFVEGERIAHARFGTGRVIAARADRVDVAFADEIRTLVHAKA